MKEFEGFAGEGMKFESDGDLFSALVSEKCQNKDKDEKKALQIALKSTICILVILLLVQNVLVSALDKIVTPPSLKDGKIGEIKYPTIQLIDCGFLGTRCLFGDGTKIADLALTDNTDTCGDTCSATQSITLYQDAPLIDDVRFYKVNENGDEALSNIRNYRFYIEQTPYEIPDYENVCDSTWINGSVKCSFKQVGSHLSSEWIDFKAGDIFPAGTYTVKLIGNKRPDWSYDWQIESQGTWIDDWAIWGNITAGAQAEVDLLSPPNNYVATSNPVSFNCSANNTVSFVTNISLWLNYTGTWAINTTVIVGSGVGTTGWNSSNTYIYNSLINVDNTPTGVNIRPLKNVTAYNVTKENDATPTHCYFWSEQYSQIVANGSYIGNICTLNNSVNLDTGYRYTIVSDNEGNNFNLVRNLVLQTGFPNNDTYINWTKGAVNLAGGQDNNFMYNIQAVGIRVNAGVQNTTQIITQSIIKTSDWTCQACDSDGACGFALENRTIFPTAFSFDAFGYNAKALSGSIETFQVNVTIDTSRYSSTTLYLNYNNTNFTASTLDSGSNRTYIANAIAPLVTTATNISFRWIVANSNSSGIFASVSQSFNQTVSPFLIDNCSLYSKRLLNFTMVDEESLIPLNGTIDVLVSLYSYGTHVLAKTYNNSFNYIIGQESAVCVDSLNSTYSMFYTIQHYGNSSLYFKKYRNLQNTIINNNTVTQNIQLYNLLLTSGNTFQVTVVGNLQASNGNTGLLVDAQRQYLAQNAFNSVESSITDTDGVTILHLVQSSVVYNFVVSYNGIVLGTFASNQVVCSNTATGQCTIILNLAQSIPNIPNYATLGNITGFFTLDSALKTLQFTFSSTDGQVHVVEQIVTKNDGYGNTTICDSTTSGTSGALTCAIPPAFQNTTFFAQILSDGQLVTTKMFSLVPAINYYGVDIFIELLMFSGLVMMFISNPITIVVGAGLGFLSSITLLFIGTNSWLRMFSVIMFYVVGGLVLISQIAKRIV
jgi:hypothetical protein